MPEDQLLEGDAGPESKCPRAESTDGARGDLEHPDASVVQPELGVDRAVRQAKRASSPRGGRDDLSLPVRWKARWCDIDRLLEEGAVQRIGFVEDGQHLELAPAKQRLDRHLLPRDEALHQDGSADSIWPARGDDRRHAREDRGKAGGILDLHHTLAARKVEGLDDAGI